MSKNADAETSEGDVLARTLASSAMPIPRRKSTKETTVNIRVTEEKKAEIKAVADLYGISITDYLIQLHDHARTTLLGPKAP